MPDRWAEQLRQPSIAGAASTARRDSFGNVMAHSIR